jgi:hypothetical protein
MLRKKLVPDLIRDGCRFSEKIMRHQTSMIRKKLVPDLIRDGCRFSDEIMLN